MAPRLQQSGIDAATICASAADFRSITPSLRPRPVAWSEESCGVVVNQVLRQFGDPNLSVPSNLARISAKFGHIRKCRNENQASWTSRQHQLKLEDSLIRHRP